MGDNQTRTGVGIQIIVRINGAGDLVLPSAQHGAGCRVRQTGTATSPG